MAAPPSYADSVSDTASTLSSLSAVGDLRDFGSPTLYRHHPSRSSSGDSGYFSTEDPSSPVAPVLDPRLNALLDAYRWTRIDMQYSELIEPFSE